MKRFDIGNSYELEVILFDKDGEYVLHKHSDVEKLIELNNEMLEALKDMDIDYGCYGCGLKIVGKCSDTCGFYKQMIAIEKAEQFNE